MTGPSINSLISRSSSIGLEPCVKYNCRFFDACKHNCLACKEFHLYVVTGRSNKPREFPTRKRYEKVFSDDET